jgi:hypothetical protein
MGTFLIEQTPKEFKATAIFQRNAQLVQVRLKRFCANSVEPPPAVERGFDLSLKHSSLGATTSADQVAFDIEVIFDAIGDGDTEKQLFHIDCCYELKYKLRPGYTPSPEELAAFQAGNALFHCWPFAREFVQNATQRMGLTVPPIPMFRVQAKRPAIAAVEDKYAEAIPGSKQTRRRHAPKEG